MEIFSAHPDTDSAKGLTSDSAAIILQTQPLNKCLIIKLLQTCPRQPVKGRISMKKTYKIEVDCANCANLMENTTGKVAGVASAVVNFMTQKMIVEFEDGADPKAVMKDVRKACKKVEPDCEIYL